MNKYWILVIVFCLTKTIYSQNSIEQNLQIKIDSIYQSHPEAVGIMVHVEAPDINISWSGATGQSDNQNQTKLQSDQPILIASSIKTYVAAAILKLVEGKMLSIEDPIEELISNKTKILLISDGYDLSLIQVKHLMSHTSGIWNYANKDYIEHKNANPKYRWTRDEQLELTVNKGNPVGLPGELFHYSDANYLLLTEIIEDKTELPFYKGMRRLLKYEELGINDTWFPTLEEKPAGTKPLAHQYWRSYGWDSYDLDISWDLYGGGGIACTLEDMASFIQNYFNGNIVKKDSIRDLIFTEIPTKETELNPYFLGLSQDRYHGMNAFGHGGFWSTVMMYFPTINTSIAVCIMNRDSRALRRNVLEEISKVVLSHNEKHLNKNNQISEYLDSLTAFSGTILIAHQDSIIKQKSFGFASIEHKVKNNIETKFNLASISKMITSIGVLQLKEQGKIDFNDKVGNYLPDYPNRIVRDSVSIHNLLTHTSGIPPFYGSQYLMTDKMSYKKVADFIPLFENLSLTFPPGDNYQYSGSNFVLLGKIIEEVTGMDYYDYIDKNIFKKANMRNSLAIPIDSIVYNKANGYTCLWGDRSYYSRNNYYISKASPAGGHFSTSRDLYLFSKGIRNGTLIKKETFSLFTTPKVKGYNTHLGYGIDIDLRYNELIIGHSGGWFGVRTELMDFLASGYTVIVLSNLDDDGQSGASKVINDIKEIIAGKKRI